jgi:hypothetical protein
MNNRSVFCSRILLTCLLFVAIAVTAGAQTPDPGIAGTHTVVKAEYNLGDLAYAPPFAALFPANMEVAGSVHYPADLASGPFPVIIILHGRHSTCYDSTSMTVAGEGWPCTGTNKSIVSYEGYDYLATNMASHGYIVISISANAINAIDGSLPDAGMNARGVLVQHHLDLWNTWTTTGGFPGDSLLFLHALNMQNIGTMGHSRGGEGVIFNAEYNRSLGSPYGIKAIMTLAPVDFFRHVLNGIPLINVAPYCDGDVNDLEGVFFYDDARYNDTTDQAAKHEIVYMGADHDLFNTVWTPGSPIPGGVDDWTYSYFETSAWCGTDAAGSGRLDSNKQKAALLPYFAAFYRVYLGHENQFAPILNVDDTIPPTSSTLTSAQVHVSYQPARMNRLDLNRTDGLSSLSTNSLGAIVATGSLLSSEVCGGGSSLSEGDCITPFSQANQPHNSNSSAQGLSQISMQWDTSAGWIQNNISIANEDLTIYHDFSFRTSVNYSLTGVDSNLNFTVQLIDSMGDTSGVAVASYSNALFYQPGSEPGDLPKLMFNTVKIPLADFTGINLAKVRAVRFVFNRSKTGTVQVSDLAFSNPPCSGLTAMFADSIGAGRHVIFTNKSSANTMDSVTWHWNFGDASSGVNDTSTLKNPPTHIYTAAGNYTVCLSVTAYRKNGYVCTDTFCNMLHIAAVSVEQLAGSNIAIAPNPASDHLNVTGAANTDVITLLDLYGQVVFRSTLTTTTVCLPHNLATGIYYAVITSRDGNKMYKKLFISQ